MLLLPNPPSSGIINQNGVLLICTGLSTVTSQYYVCGTKRIKGMPARQNPNKPPGCNGRPCHEAMSNAPKEQQEKRAHCADDPFDEDLGLAVLPVPGANNKLC